MNKTTLIAALQSAGITAGSWTSKKELSVINLESDANHYHDFLTQMIYFDTTNEILRIKEYVSSIASSKFFKINKTGNSTYKMFPDGFGYYGVKEVVQMKQFRNPTVGDIFFTVDSSNTFVEAEYITAISGDVITLASDLDLDGYTAAYASGKTFEISNLGQIAPRISGQLQERFLESSTVLLSKKPITDNVTDVYVSTTNIEGFEFRQYRIDPLV